jgi:hypothetical protein
MQTHEHYEELCALAAIGQLSPEEHQELSAHLRACDLCRRAGDDFAVILDQLPSATPPDDSGDTEELLSESYRQKFLQKAAEEGVRFTPEVTGSARMLSFALPWGRKWQLLAFAAAVSGMLAIAIFIGTSRFRDTNRQISRSSPAQAGTGPTVSPGPHSQLPQQQKDDAFAGRIREDELERQVSVLKEQVRRMLIEKDRVQTEYALLKQQLAQLEAHSDSTEQALSQGTSELETVRKGEAQLIATLVEKENRIRELSEELSAQTVALERERELSTAAKDVRELMAARNMHMIDVYDFDTRGKRDKSFGRVFYTGNSMIFYAFDLSDKGQSSKVTFQAWGQREGGGTAPPKNLGVFYVDDHAQKRWVLRVENPKLLSSIDSVFVTVEPSPGRDQPSGKKLLYAYLGTPPNHP